MLGLIILAVIQSVTPRVASDMQPGLRLTYASNGAEQSPWTIDSVEAGVALMPAADCARVLLRRSADQPRPNESRYCVRRDTLHAWDPRRSAWAPQRPVGPGMTFVQPRAGGDTVRYTTDVLTVETISGVRLPVLATTVMTVDSLGRPKRRLRERYALTLATATGGVFEVPDSTAPGGWRHEQTFELRAITAPR